MHKRKFFYLVILCSLLVVLLGMPVSASVGVNVDVHSKEEILQFINSHKENISDPVQYAQRPSTKVPYDPGKLSASTLQSAINMLNQVRYIAGLSSNVALDETMNERCQAGCLIDSVNGILTHYPDQPADMDDELYNLGYSGTIGSNMGRQHATLTAAIINGWMSDHDDDNISSVGHRTIMLEPKMAKTGFGYVYSFSAMYGLDESGTGGQTGIVWPAQVMPREYFATEDPWSYFSESSLKKANVTVSLVREADGKTWNFSADSADGFFTVSGKAVIFRPDGISDYASDDIYHVRIKNHGAVLAQYDVNFFSINPVTALTLSDSEISLEHSGDSIELKVSRVEPASASTSIIWSSSDEKVATVNVSGSDTKSAVVTAAGAGRARITATSSNGRVQSVCEVIVHDFVESGLTADKTQMQYTCSDCGEHIYKNAITSIDLVCWRKGDSGNYYEWNYTSIQPEVGQNFGLNIWRITPEKSDDTVLVTTDRPDILSFTSKDGKVFTGVPLRAGKVEITVSSKLNPEVKQTQTTYVNGPLIVDSMTAVSTAEPAEEGVCGAPVNLELELAGGKQPYAITFTAMKDDGSEEIIAANADSTTVQWIPSAKGKYTLKAVVKDFDGVSLTKTIENFSVRKAAVKESASSPVALADQQEAFVFGQTLGSASLNAETAVFTGEAGESVKGKLAWTDEERVPNAGKQAFFWIFTPDNEEAYEGCSGELILEVEKAAPVLTIQTQALSNEYYDSGRTLGDESISGSAQIQYKGENLMVEGTFRWAEPDTVPAAGTNKYTVLFTPKAGADISEASAEIALTLKKAMPVIHKTEAPNVPDLTYGMRLADCSAEVFSVYDKESSQTPLRGTYVWQNPETMPAVKDSMTTLYEVIFTPDDPNYEPYMGAAAVKVNRAKITVRPDAEMKVPYSVTSAADCTLPEGWTLMEADKGQALPEGTALKVTAVYKDQENYADPTQTIMITRSSCDHHSTETRVYKEASCTEEGLEKTWCTICHEELDEHVLDVVPHTVEIDEAAAATCTDDGLTEGKHCSVCGEVLAAQEVIPAAGHVAVIDAAVEATTTQTGLTEGSHCAVCGTVLVSQQEIPKVKQPETPGGTEGNNSDQPQPEQKPESKPEQKPVPSDAGVPSVVTGEISPDKPVKSEAVVNQALQAVNDNDQKGSAFGLLQAKGTAASPTAVKLTWKRVPNASAYIIFGNKCGKGMKYQQITTVNGTSFTQKNLKKGSYYKYLVIAVNGNKALSVSKTIHTATKGGKVGNAKKVTVNKNTVKLKPGKTFKIKAKAVPQSAAMKIKKHRALSYESTDPRVAVVNAKGVIKAAGKGNCFIYVYAQNGVSKRIKVVVK